MFKHWQQFILILLLWAGPAIAGDDPIDTGATGELSRQDMEIIAMMEILQLMDLAESMDVIKDMDVLMEGKENETQD